MDLGGLIWTRNSLIWTRGELILDFSVAVILFIERVSWGMGPGPSQGSKLRTRDSDTMTLTHCTCTSRQMTLTSAYHKLFRWWLWPPQLFASWGSWHPTHPNSSFIRTNCLLLVCCTPLYHPLIWTLNAVAANLQDWLVLDLNQTLLCSCSDWCFLQSFHQN